MYMEQKRAILLRCVLKTEPENFVMMDANKKPVYYLDY